MAEQEHFDAKCVKLDRNEDGTWVESYERVHNSKEMIDIVGQGVEQVNISKYIKLYFSTEGVEKWNGIKSKYRNDGLTEYMAAPLLLVECDDNVPIDITQETIDTIKSHLELF